MATEVRNTDCKKWESVEGKDWMAEHKRTQVLLDKLYARSNKLDPWAKDLTGAMLRFPIGDGYAFYQVVKTKPLQVMHISYGDAWRVDDIMIRGLRLDDVREELRRERSLAKLFGKQTKKRKSA